MQTICLKPITPEDACDLVMPWGKFRGKSLAEVYGTEGGPDYLAWLVASDKVGGSIRRAAIALMRHFNLYTKPTTTIDDSDVPF